MKLEAEIFDNNGNEIEMKPNHALLMGKESFCQIPLDDWLFPIEMTYRPPSVSPLEYQKNIIAEWGTIEKFYIISKENVDESGC
jgi:hypothetical protein